jgi:hypothetical protein
MIKLEHLMQIMSATLLCYGGGLTAPIDLTHATPLPKALLFGTVRENPVFHRYKPRSKPTGLLKVFGMGGPVDQVTASQIYAEPH